jgi:predicted  nucleic acid-binding Zn-ribbon protein
MDAHARYRIDLLQNRIKELEQWQEQAREDIARMERAIVALAEPRSTPTDLGEVAAMMGLTDVR